MSKTRTLTQQSCRLVAAPASQLDVFPIPSRFRWMMGTRRAFTPQFLHGHAALPVLQLLRPTGLRWTVVLTQSAPFAGLICEIFSRSDQFPVCQGLADPQGCGSYAVHVFLRCPRSLFRLSCLTRLTAVGGRVWCPACLEDVGSSGSATSMVWSFLQIVDVQFALSVWRT